MFKKLSSKFMVILMIIFLVSQIIMPYVSNVKADARPESVRVVTDEAEKEILLGTTSEKAKAENILGLASKFSLFTKGDITLTGADAEGKIASGGTITANTSYPYHAGSEVKDESVAKIIAQNGINSNFGLDFTAHCYGSSRTVTYDDTKKIAAVGTNATNVDWSNMTTEQLNYMVAADLIDFESEFNYLQQQSNYFAGLAETGTITKCYGFGDRDKGINKAVVFSGSNETLNIFNMTVSEFNNLFNTYPDTITGSNGNNILDSSYKYAPNIFFNVPKGSYIIINIVGEGNIKFSTKLEDEFMEKANIYFAAEEEDLSSLSNPIEYAFDGKDFIRDEKGNVKAFKMVWGSHLSGNVKLFSEDTLEYSQYLLYNMPQAKSFEITNSMFGSILAPRASGTDNSYGYVYGTIACNSYSGGIQFGYLPNTIELDSEFDVKIKKIDSKTNENIADVELQITDLSGNIIRTWTTTENESTVKLKNGEYILKEIKAADNYSNPKENITYFTVKGNKYNNNNYYKIELEAEETKVNLQEHSYTTANINYRKFNDLYRDTGLSTSSDIGESYVQELEFKIDTNSIDNIDDLYYIVACNGWGYEFNIHGNMTWYQPTDWVEFKKWTKVTDGINVKIPINVGLYNNGGHANDSGMKVHFYTSDGIEVTDQITITDLIIKWYTTNEKTTKYVYSSDDIFLNDEEDTIIITNDHITTTVELTKQDSDSPTTLLQGAVYEIQDSEGNTVKNSEGNNLVFEATNTDGKSTLEDLRLDVGTYYLVETKAPEGYKLSDEKISFTVKPHTSETITKTVKDEKIKVNVEKQDEYGNLLSGANLQILNEDNIVVKSWSSSNEIEEIEGLSPGEYILHENYAPSGFVKSEDIPFTINDKGEVLVNNEKVEKIVMVNNTLKGTINITKKGESLVEVNELNKLEKYKAYQFIWKENPIENVFYDLYAKDDIYVNGTKIYSKDEKISTIYTGVDGIANYSGLVAGEYYVIEVSAPEQYEIDSEKHNISLIVTYDEQNNQKLISTIDLLNERKKATIELTKTEKDSNITVEGAIYGLYNQEKIASIEENTLLDVVMTDEKGKGNFEADLPVGNYYIKEIEAPEGYLLSEESEYINFNESDNFKVKVEDDYIKLNILKTDKNGNPLAGAKLQILDKSEKVIVPEWTTDQNPKEIVKTLNIGETYILRELQAPAGYAKASDKNFVVLNTNDIQEINFINYETKVSITKQSEDNKILEGAELKLVEIDTETNAEKEIANWTTRNTKHEINGILEYGKKYKVIENKSPDGYVTAEPLEFIVEDTQELQEFTMIDNPTKIAIYKQDENGNNLTGAKLQLLDSEGTPVEEWTSTDKPYEIIGKLVVGKTYTIKELEAPNGFVIGEDKQFTVEDKSEVQNIYVQNKATKIVVNKLDENDNNLEGATLQILNENNEIIDMWESTTSGHTVDNKLVINKKYTLKELKSPAGYAIADDVEFTVTNTQEIQVVNIKNSRLQILVEKVNEDKELISGAELQITDVDGNILENWESTTEAHTVNAKLEIGETYILKETKPADGYVTAKDKLFTVINSKEAQLISLTDEKTRMSFAKYDEQGNLVPGATFQIIDEEENIVDEWTTQNTEHEVIGKLIVGKTYTLKEVNTPDGFTTSEDYVFTVSDTGSTQEVEIKELKTKVKISKQDITTGKEIQGAKLTVAKEDGTVIDTWISEEKPHYIEGKLVAGKTYTLTEEIVPNGYVTANQITFTVEDTWQVQEVVMKDDTTKVNITKVDENGDIIKGATLQLKDDEGNIIKEWISKDVAQEFIGELIVGKTYTLTEMNPPDGYVTAIEKTFTVQDTAELQEIQMTNNKTKVSISKQDITTGEEIIGAELRVETVEGEIIDKWISTDKPHEIKGTLIAGKTYVLTEITAPEGYVKSESIVFEVKDTEEVQKLEMKDDYTKVRIEKVDKNGKYLRGAELQIINQKGDVIEKWTTEDNVYEINKKLIAGETYILQEIKAPNGYKKAENVVFKVSENGEVDTVKIVNIKENIISKIFPKTGDMIIGYIIVTIVALICIIIIIYKQYLEK